MPADTFTLVIDVNELVGGAASSKGTLTIRYQGTAQYAIFDGDDLRALDHYSGKGGHVPPSVSAGFEVDLPTDVASGGNFEDSAVGYDVTWRSEHATVRATFKARSAGSTWNISALTNPETIPTAESAANADRARAAADEAAGSAGAAAASADLASEVSGLTGEDDAVALLLSTASDSRAEMDARIGSRTAFLADTNGSALRNALTRSGNKPVGRGEQEISPLDYGAAGNGTTDDTAAVQAALDAATMLGVRAVTLTRPHVVSTLSVPSRVTLHGDGGKLLHKAGSASSCVSIPATSTDAAVVGIEVDGAAVTSGTSSGIIVRGSRNRVQDCYVHDTIWDGISIAGGTKHLVSGCNVVTTGRYGITINYDGTTPTRHVRVIGNHVEASNDGALGIVGVAENVTFVGNTTKDHGGDGIAAYNGLNKSITCVGNVFENPGNHGIHLGGARLVMAENIALNVGPGHGFFAENNNNGATTAYNVSITGNVVHGTVEGEGIRVGKAQVVTVSGNTLYQPARHGIYLDTVNDFTVASNVVRENVAGDGLRLLRTGRGSITGNAFRLIAGDAIHGRDDAGTACTDVVVTGNEVGTATGWGLRTTDSSNRWLHGTNMYRACALGAKSLVGAGNVASGSDLVL